MLLFCLRAKDKCAQLNGKWEFCAAGKSFSKFIPQGSCQKAESDSTGLGWRRKQWCVDLWSLFISLVEILPLPTISSYQRVRSLTTELGRNVHSQLERQSKHKLAPAHPNFYISNKLPVMRCCWSVDHAESQGGRRQ